jgi:hypothetical protein
MTNKSLEAAGAGTSDFNVTRSGKATVEAWRNLDNPIASAIHTATTWAHTATSRLLTDGARLFNKEDREPLKDLGGFTLTGESIKGIPRFFKGLTQLPTKNFRQGVGNILEGGGNALETLINPFVDGILDITKNTRGKASTALATSH